MPKKSKRVAARQAQLSRRKHHGRGPTAPEQMKQHDDAVDGAVEAARGNTWPPPPVTEEGGAVSASPLPAPPRLAAQRRAAAADPMQRTAPYLRRELLQIGMVSSLIFSILIALTFVLR